MSAIRQAAISVYGGELENRQVAGALRPHRGLRLPRQGGLAGRCVAENAPALIGDPHDDP